MANVIPAFPGMKLVMPCKKEDGTYEALFTDIIGWNINPGGYQDFTFVEEVIPVVPGDFLSLHNNYGIMGTDGHIETLGGVFYKTLEEYQKAELK